MMSKRGRVPVIKVGLKGPTQVGTAARGGYEERPLASRRARSGDGGISDRFLRAEIFWWCKSFLGGGGGSGNGLRPRSGTFGREGPLRGAIIPCQRALGRTPMIVSCESCSESVVSPCMREKNKLVGADQQN